MSSVKLSRVPEFRPVAFKDDEGVCWFAAFRDERGRLLFRAPEWMPGCEDAEIRSGFYERQSEVLWWLLEGNLSKPPGGWCFDDSVALDEFPDPALASLQ